MPNTFIVKLTKHILHQKILLSYLINVVLELHSYLPLNGHFLESLYWSIKKCQKLKSLNCNNYNHKEEYYFQRILLKPSGKSLMNSVKCSEMSLIWWASRRSFSSTYSLIMMARSWIRLRIRLFIIWIKRKSELQEKGRKQCQVLNWVHKETKFPMFSM
jgi:hypothetical protein